MIRDGELSVWRRHLLGVSEMTGCNTCVPAYAEIDNHVDGESNLVGSSMFQLSLKAAFDCLIS